MWEAPEQQNIHRLAENGEEARGGKATGIKAELRLRMHEPVAEVGAWLRKVGTGYHRYYAIPGNIDRLSVFGQRLRRLWWLILRRRSQRPVTWDRPDTSAVS